jgi:hypothetical protein
VRFEPLPKLISAVEFAVAFPPHLNAINAGTNTAYNNSNIMDTRLCERCSVIQFCDRWLEPYLVKEDGGPVALSISPTRIGRGMKIPLDYEVVDILPNLFCLQQSADRGCVFCFALRHEITRARFDYHGYVNIRLAYHWGNDRFKGLGLAALTVELQWRPDIPSIPPASAPPNTLRDCIIFALETNDGEVSTSPPGI